MNFIARPITVTTFLGGVAFHYRYTLTCLFRRRSSLFTEFSTS